MLVEKPAVTISVYLLLAEEIIGTLIERIVGELVRRCRSTPTSPRSRPAAVARPGAALVNDVSGLRDVGLADVCARNVPPSSSCTWCCPEAASAGSRPLPDMSLVMSSTSCETGCAWRWSAAWRRHRRSWIQVPISPRHRRRRSESWRRMEELDALVGRYRSPSRGRTRGSGYRPAPEPASCRHARRSRSLPGCRRPDHPRARRRGRTRLPEGPGCPARRSRCSRRSAARRLDTP